MGKKTLAQEYYQAPPFDVMLEPESWRGRWEASFGRRAPVHVEIGIGLGHHLAMYAAEHPGMNHVGLEMKMHRIYTARHKVLRAGTGHVRFVLGDAQVAMRAFAPGEVDRITLLFPDPWHGDRFAERRLTHPERLQAYARALSSGGVFHFRTDDEALFEYTLAHLARQPFDVRVAVERGRILTDFEKRWLAQGRWIYGLDACRTGLK